MPDDRRQALAGPGDVRPGVRAAMPDLDCDPAVAVADQRGVALCERFVDAAVVGRAVVHVSVDEAGVEGRQQPPALALRDHRRSANRGARRLVAPRVVGEIGAGVVEPGEIGDVPRIVGLGAEGRHQHRRTTPDGRPGRLPDTLAAKPVPEDRLDPRRPGTLSRMRPRDFTGLRQARQLRTALRGRVPGVVDVLDLIDHLVAEGDIGPHPLDAVREEGRARWPQHPVRVGVDRRREQDEEDTQDQESPASLAPGRSLAPPLLSVRRSAGERLRAGRQVSRIRRIIHGRTGTRLPQITHLRKPRLD